MRALSVNNSQTNDTSPHGSEDEKPEKSKEYILKPKLIGSTSIIPIALSLGILVVVWEVWTLITNVPVYIVPSPHIVLQRLIQDIDFFAWHMTITLLEALTGLAIGSIIAITSATFMAHSKFLEKTLFPIALIVKVTPIIAIAPLLVIWFGFGFGPKISIAALITFFPVLVNTLTGLRSVNPNSLDFFRSINASKKEIFFHLRVPSCLPYLFAAFRIAVPLSVIGAVVGEFFTGSVGLGSIIFIAHHNLDMPTAFSSIFILALISISLNFLISYLENKLLFWDNSYTSIQ